MGIDIIVPVYNRERFIKECIESVLNQTYADWNLILVDDGSLDSSGSICDEFAEKDSRITVIHQENGGVSAARNSGIAHSDNEFICFLDSDDLYEPNALEIMNSTLNENNVDAAFFNMKNTYQDKTILKSSRLKNGIYSFDDIGDILVDDGTLTGILLGSVCSAIYKRSVIERFNLSFNKEIAINEDGVFNINYMTKCGSIYYNGNEHLYCYRQWKTEKNEKELKYNIEFEKVNAVITSIYKNTECDYEKFEKQMELRKISIAFWNIHTIAKSKKSFFSCYKFVRFILKEHNSKQGYNYISANTSGPKKVILFFMKRHLCMCLTFLIKVIIPLFFKR
ncbi:MAG: glycosyltransferase family 2 protein [Clostridia bacterium]|nr:glycosyltransferase family 2 protein [Clostridia bacterium]